PDHPSGTDRCAEVARRFPQAQAVLNVQGDEPFIQPEQIELLARTLLSDRRSPIATLVKKIDSPEALFNPNVVKAAFAENTGQALYFSRHPLPYLRGIPEAEWLSHHPFYRHIGLYGFRRAALLRIARLAPTPLEQAESLEQLRWLEHGFRIRVATTCLETLGIDTPQDLQAAEAWLRENG
ncbi:MAG TPA: manno-octulosonate cytidylyltransferase, partial [Saprospiraceae bacterium]|nr:manno-octulosonate cytidylyltransferase [Saprospiraceae bacterium]